MAHRLIGWYSPSFTLLGVITTIIGTNLLCEFYDYQQYAPSGIRPFHGTFITGYRLLADRIVYPNMVRNLGYLMLLTGALCYIGLVFLLDWPVLFFYGLSFFLAYTYVCPPIQYASRGWGLGEIGLFCSYGLLPLLGSYYVQTNMLTELSLWVGLLFGLFVMLVLNRFNSILYRRDWLNRKRTLVVHWGTARALDFDVLLIILAYVGLLLLVSLGYLPLLTLVVLGLMPILLGTFTQVMRERPRLHDSVQLYTTAIIATILTGLFFNVALWADVLW